jgi:hypothetical protein
MWHFFGVQMLKLISDKLNHRNKSEKFSEKIHELQVEILRFWGAAIQGEERLFMSLF